MPRGGACRHRTLTPTQQKSALSPDQAALTVKEQEEEEERGARRRGMCGGPQVRKERLAELGRNKCLTCMPSPGFLVLSANPLNGTAQYHLPRHFISSTPLCPPQYIHTCTSTSMPPRHHQCPQHECVHAAALRPPCLPLSRSLARSLPFSLALSVDHALSLPAATRLPPRLASPISALSFAAPLSCPQLSVAPPLSSLVSHV